MSSVANCTGKWPLMFSEVPNVATSRDDLETVYFKNFAVSLKSTNLIGIVVVLSVVTSSLY
jgi:hypothetical protein